MQPEDEREGAVNEDIGKNEYEGRESGGDGLGAGIEIRRERLDPAAAGKRLAEDETQCRNGEYVVMPAHSRGAARSSARPSGMRST